MLLYHNDNYNINAEFESFGGILDLTSYYYFN